MRKLPPLNGLKAFEASARHLNFRAAAEELNVTQGAVAQQVRNLETLLELQLFDRQARGLALTEEGRQYFAPVRRAFDLLGEATENLHPQESFITISTTPSFATKWLVPRLGRFSEEHPDVRVRLDASTTIANFQSDGVDIAVRLGRPPFGPGLEATPLFPSSLILVCHPDLLQGDHPLTTPENLAHHILLQDAHGLWSAALEQVFGSAPLPHMRMMNFSQTSLAIDAAIAGQGVALANRAFVETDLAANRLCQPFPLSVEAEEGHYIVAPRMPRNRKPVDIMRNWLIGQQSPAEPG